MRMAIAQEWFIGEFRVWEYVFSILFYIYKNTY